MGERISRIRHFCCNEFMMYIRCCVLYTTLTSPQQLKYGLGDVGSNSLEKSEISVTP